MDDGQTPGAVALVGRGDDVLFHAAFGDRMVAPERRPMLPDTVFDLASLTKPVCTATCVMQLLEQGKLVLADPVSRFIPGFARHYGDTATIRHLLTHSSGLQAYRNFLDTMGTDVAPEQRRPLAIQDICAMEPAYPTGSRFMYTCLGYIVLASVVEAITGEPLDEYARKHVFEPLGMTETGFNPGPELVERCAATEQLPDGVLLGVVHDEAARFLNGVGGNAGLFSTASDLSRFMRAILNQGEWRDARVLSPLSTALMMSAQSQIPDGVRGLGWDVSSPHTPGPRGDLFPPGTIGHTGYTGTSIWADPASRTYAILLTNRVHLGRDKDVGRLRRQVANIVASHAVPSRRFIMVAPANPVRTGLDELRNSRFEAIRGMKLGLVCNHTSIDGSRKHLLDLLLSAPDVEIGAILSPEHGFAGLLDELVPSETHETGLPIHSLYGEHQSPTPEMLEGLDALVYDIADIGVRFYTYTTTMTLCMKAAAQAQIPFFVLDRPNPINGTDVEGPVLDKPFGLLSAWHPIPLRHGLTSGELALWSNGEYEIGCDLRVVNCAGWRRYQWFDQTGLPWVNPSPNMRNLKQAILYPATGTLEATNISVGRGTDTPFEVLGAPWIDGSKLARRLNSEGVDELTFTPIEFTPNTREFVGEQCGGVYIMLGDRTRFKPVRAAVQIARALRELWPESFNYRKLTHLLGSGPAVDAVGELQPVDAIVNAWEPEIEEFLKRRGQYLLYG